MGAVLIVLGLVWTGIGLADITTLLWAEFEQSGAVGTTQLMPSMLLFVVPGLGIAGMGFALRIRRRRQPAGTSAEAEARARKCAYCAEPIVTAAVTCRSCGRDLPTSDDQLKRNDDFEKWLVDQQPPLRELTSAERRAYRQAYDHQFPRD
jgi:hypothetical protein